MTTAAKKAKATETPDEIMQNALKFYEEALKTSILLQEDALKLWKDVLTQASTPEELKKKLEEIAQNILPESKKNMDDVVALFQNNATHCKELFRKTLNVYQAGSFAEGQAGLQDLVESSLSAMHSNVHAIVDTNTQIMKSWDKMFTEK